MVIPSRADRLPRLRGNDGLVWRRFQRRCVWHPARLANQALDMLYACQSLHFASVSANLVGHCISHPTRDVATQQMDEHDRRTSTGRRPPCVRILPRSTDLPRRLRFELLDNGESRDRHRERSVQKRPDCARVRREGAGCCLRRRGSGVDWLMLFVFLHAIGKHLKLQANETQMCGKQGERLPIFFANRSRIAATVRDKSATARDKQCGPW